MVLYRFGLIRNNNNNMTLPNWADGNHHDGDNGSIVFTQQSTMIGEDDDQLHL